MSLYYFYSRFFRHFIKQNKMLLFQSLEFFNKSNLITCLAFTYQTSMSLLVEPLALFPSKHLAKSIGFTPQLNNNCAQFPRSLEQRVLPSFFPHSQLYTHFTSENNPIIDK